MNPTVTYSTSQGLFQEFLSMLGKMVHSQLVRQIEYLKVENQILRAKTKPAAQRGRPKTA